MSGEELIGRCQQLYSEAISEWGFHQWVSHWETSTETFQPFCDKAGLIPDTLLGIPVRYRQMEPGEVALISRFQSVLVVGSDGRITSRNPI
jgi:hypothetical protein